jgi:hypothetical protein
MASRSDPWGKYVLVEFEDGEEYFREPDSAVDCGATRTGRQR